MSLTDLKLAIDANDLEQVKRLMTLDPALHRAQLGYRNAGPLTWVAECRVPWEPPGPARLAIAKWMIENGSDVHQGGDAPLMRAALNGDRIPMMELLVAHGANVNAAWNGHYPIIHAPCETLDPRALQWLLDHGADPDCRHPSGWSSDTHTRPGTALDFVIATYWRCLESLRACIDILLRAGGTTKYSEPAVFAVLRGQLEVLRVLLDADPSLVSRRFPDLEFGATANRGLTLRGSTLLHVAAEYGDLEAARLLLDRGADVNGRATVDQAGVGGQTPIFHAATQFADGGLPMVELLLERGADMTVRVRLPGHHARPEERAECSPLGYALLFPGTPSQTIDYLRQCGAAA